MKKVSIWQTMGLGNLKIAALLLAIFSISGTTSGVASLSEAESTSLFEQWSTLAGGQQESPALANSRKHDLITRWQGANGESVTLVVRQPVFLNNRKRVLLNPPPKGSDARPVIESALQRLHAENANTLSLAPGDYDFLSTEPKFKSHLRLEDLSDFILEGNGARLNFYNNAPGIWIQQSQRIRVERLTLNYALRTTSIGRIVDRAGQRFLVVDSAYPVDASSGIAQIVELRPDALNYVVGGGRVIFLPKDTSQASFLGAQTYASPRFAKLVPGSRYMLLHQYYGGQAIKIDGHRTPSQTEDITLAALKLHAAPGMGVAVTGLRRGLAVIDSQFVAAGDGSNAGGVSWDGVHIHSGGGDILIKGNRFELLGDDAINLSNPIHTLSAIDMSSGRVTLAGSSRFIAQGDTLAFFAADGGFLGTSKVVSRPITGGNNEFVLGLDQLPPGANLKSVVRTIELIARRYMVADNLIQNISGHAVLAQIPHGLITNNTVQNINRNAIRLLSDIGTWNEGVGAFNVAIRSNTIINPGVDPVLDFPWAAITAYSGASGRVLSPHFYNRDLEISDNRIENYRQGCISVTNSLGVVSRRNTCIRDSNAEKTALPWIAVRSKRLINE